MSKFTFNDHADRRSAASEARKALLDKFKTRAADESPDLIARKAERDALVQARDERQAAKAAEIARIKAEKEAHAAAEKAAREATLAAERAARQAQLNSLTSRVLKEQLDWKAARLAARKKR
ncbi:MAG: DUF6481 family protein [Beijerinckiaceae bacterium]